VDRAQFAYDEIDEIYNIIVNGDGTSPGAANVFNGSAGIWAYSDMVHLAMSFDVPSQMTHVIGTKTDIEKILNLAQYQDPDTWHAAQLFSQQGRYQGLLPMNAKLVVSPNAVSTKFAALDKRFAIRESLAQPLMIEAEKIITQKLESAVISKESVYTIMVDEALGRRITKPCFGGARSVAPLIIEVGHARTCPPNLVISALRAKQTTFPLTKSLTTSARR